VEIKAPRPASVSQTVRIYAEYVFPKTKFPLFSEFLTAILQEKIFVLILQKEKKEWKFSFFLYFAPTVLLYAGICDIPTS